MSIHVTHIKLTSKGHFQMKKIFRNSNKFPAKRLQLPILSVKNVGYNFANIF